MTRSLLIFTAGALTCLTALAIPGLIEMAHVAAWMACRAMTSGVCL